MPVQKRAERAAQRGCLHKIVVTNFKSYAGELTIGPFKDFTCVIGPNGSGKSNLMDAVSFVVGVNTNQLRGTRLADFRTNLESKSDADTSVTLYYNTSASGEETEEIRFTRTITKNDTSEYRIDGKKVGEKEYQKRLRSVGLLVKSRNFLVFQNEVETVAQKSPKQLTELLERISGSEDLKKDYEELSEEKQTTANVAVAVYKRSLLINNEKKQVKEQVKEATTYQELQQKEADIRTLSYLFELFHVESELKTCADELDGHAESLVEKEKDVKAMSKAVEKQSKVKAEKEKEWAAVDKKVDELEKSIKKIQQKDILPLDSELKTRKAELERLAKDLETAKKQLKETKTTADQDQRHYEDIKAELDEQESEVKKSKDIQLGQEQVAKYNTLKQQAKAKTFKARKSVDELERQHNHEKRELDKSEEELRRLTDKQSMAASKSSDSASLKEKNVKKVEEMTAQEHKLVSEITDVEKKMREDTAVKCTLLKRQQDFLSQIGDARADEKTHKRDAQFKERLSYLSQSFKGVQGRVLDLCKVKQHKYELAVTVVMEGNMDAVVVDKEETVRRCVEYLRDNKLPPMTFLPLDSISAKAPDERLRMIPDAKLALDVIDYDKSVEKAMWYVTGNAVIVKDLKTAKEIAYQGTNQNRCKVVTLDASVISKTGALTGGDTSQLISKSQRWQGQGIEDLKNKCAANERDLQAVQQSLSTGQTTLQGLQGKHMKVKNELATAKRLLQNTTSDANVAGKEVESYKATIAKHQPKVEQLRASVESKKAALDKESQAMSKIEDEIFKGFCKEVGIANITEFEGTTFAQQKERNEKMLRTAGTAAKLKHKVEKGHKDVENINNRVEKKKKEQEKLLDETKQLREKEAKATEAIKKAMEDKAEQVRVRKAAKAVIDEQVTELKNRKDVLKVKLEEKESVQRLVDKVESNIERLQSQRRTTFEACEIEEISLPKKGRGSGGGGDGEGDDPMDVEESAGASQSQSAQNVRNDISSAKLDYSRLTREQKKQMSSKEQERVKGGLEEDRKKIGDTIASMNPNMKAMEQLKEVEAKAAEVQEEIKEAKHKATEVSQRFEEVKSERCQLFNDCFDHVKSHIDNIYKELTSEPSKQMHSVGGSAYLTLNCQEEPYLDGIKYDTIPPGKRFMDMTHLSGGEKTVAALALLFAINSFCPAPFIVLDEVDAALDARNVAKVTRYIQSRRLEQQCVIISLKERFYEKADGLVGICRDMSQGHSKVFTLNLAQYEVAAT
mmetsp:Transcript_10154/g.24576  ORF Transcript_10154/g.24576 Transcript_10154/m.24576 type:complete len:1249 (+) Transcript_10154:130-3876(+)